MVAKPRSLRLVKSRKPSKKWTAIFRLTDGSRREVHFGARAYEDYTQHRDADRRARYRARHRRDKLNDPMSPGALSYFILWGDSTNRDENLEAFRRKFGLSM